MTYSVRSLGISMRSVIYQCNGITGERMNQPPLRLLGGIGREMGDIPQPQSNVEVRLALALRGLSDSPLVESP